MTMYAMIQDLNKKNPHYYEAVQGHKLQNNISMEIENKAIKIDTKPNLK